MEMPLQPPDIKEVLQKLVALGVDAVTAAFQTTVGAEVEGKYLHWDQLRHRTPPSGLAPDVWWLLIDTARTATRVALPLQEAAERTFGVSNPDSVRRLVYTIDRDASGRIELPAPVLNAATRDRYVVAGLIEEAITSSQLEGASTTRGVAKEMLRTGRPPRTTDEKMIANNYRAMEWAREHRNSPPTTELILELHRIVTEDTLDELDAGGRFRRHDEPIRVVDHDSGEVVHMPPPASELAERMTALCVFAAGATPTGFVHPVVRAILTHFWLAFDHPFVDGNGRTARALFYWQMLREGYWLVEFVSISRLLRKAPAQYARAFLHAETTRDATYFVLHQLETLRCAIDDMFAYVKRKAAAARSVEAELRAGADVNHRQLDLLARLLRDPDAAITIEAHQRTHGVVYETARGDLRELEQRGWLIKHKVGRTFSYHPARDLERRLKARPR
jgi:Fic family protein